MGAFASLRRLGLLTIGPARRDQKLFPRPGLTSLYSGFVDSTVERGQRIQQLPVNRATRSRVSQRVSRGICHPPARNHCTAALETLRLVLQLIRNLPCLSQARRTGPPAPNALESRWRRSRPRPPPILPPPAPSSGGPAQVTIWF